MSTIINLTQHAATPEQIAQGVFNVAPESQRELTSLLNFTSLPTAEIVKSRAIDIAAIAHEAGVESAMIGGAPFLMGALECALKAVGVTPVFAFSERVSEEKVVDGVVTKVSVFKHRGFVEV